MIVAVLARAAAGVNGIAQGVRALTGWRRYAVAALLGVAATSALPPTHLVPLVIVSFTGLIWLIEGSKGIRGAFAIGWAFGLGHFGTGFYWIANSLLVDAARFGWVYPFCVLFFGSAFAIYIAVAAAALKATRARGLSAVFAFAALWTAVEWLRGHLFTGFPWNLIGTVWAGSETMMQFASIVGAYGLGTLTVLAAAMPATLAGGAQPVAERWGGTLAVVAMIAAIWVFGWVRLGGVGDAVVPGVVVRLVQPDIAQDLKWNPAQRERNFEQTLAISRGPGFERVTHVIWPETAIPFAISDDPARRAAIAAAVPPRGFLIAGAPRVERAPGRPPRVWNSLFTFDPSGAITATFDKFHLVPFGEFMPRPFRWALDWLRLTEGMGDFDSGPGPRTLAPGGFPSFSPLICYEVIFPNEVIDPARRPDLLLNITNDAWFGISPGPFQHFAASRFRAIEEGLPLVRAANNGISAVVDSYGRVLAQLGLGREGTLDSTLPRPIAAPLYAQIGDLALATLLLAMTLLAVLLRRRG
ncbi:MAG: apolipoprotein N-acyltransferase [Alphaproteobacteria bacterium]|nr:apolipoprotein N-acyltransferase [Alphaproteobacteria bacterium]